MERTCGNCIFFEKDDGSPYCLLLDLYTEREQDDEACEDFEEAQNRSSGGSYSLEIYARGMGVMTNEHG